MSSNTYFSGMPSINIPRSRWKTDYNITGSFKHGYLIPWEAIPVLPGDTISYAFKDITRMQTPIAPIFGNIKQDFFAFFVPLRLVWSHTEEFFGANKTSAGFPTSTYTFPIARYGKCDVGSPAHYLGKPYKGSTETDADGKNYYEASPIKERCYYAVYNEYFRAQQVTNPVLLSLTDLTNENVSSSSSVIGTKDGSTVDCSDSSGLMKVAKEFDYFTASTIQSQYGGAVELPLGLEAPIVGSPLGYHNLDANHRIKFGDGSNNSTSSNIFEHLGFRKEPSTSAGVLGVNETDTVLTNFRQVINTNMVADLSTATAAKVNDVRYAFAIQKYLERANFAGNYFFGILQVHYGVTSPDSRLQRPEFLGKFTENILVHQVVSTADTVNSGVKTSVGNTGAMSVTPSGLVHLFDKAFVEPGYVIILRCCRQRQVYSQGIMREDWKKDRFEIYTPELCNLGDQITKTREVYWKAGESDNFGYQEHWAEYRYRPDRVTGMLDPVPSTGLEFWTLANNFSSKPQLNDSFIEESRDNVDRAIVTADSYDEYVADTYNEIIFTREMPVRTIPGLIDHFGAM